MKTFKHAIACGVMLLLSACQTAPQEPYYQLSGAVFYPYEQVKEKAGHFADYVKHSRAQLNAHRVFHDLKRTGQELEDVAPFILPLPQHCPAPRKGVLLVHGLLDTAYALKDMGRVLANECVRVYGLLLPGHGTRPGDLIRSTRDDWLAAVRFGVRALAAEVDDVTVMGFSLGGLLATHVASEEDGAGAFIQRLVLLAPALEVSYPTLSRFATFYRHLADWVDVDPPHIPVRYQSMPTQAVAETFLLSRQVQQRLSQKSLRQPVFMVLSADDLVIDAKASLTLFQTTMPHSKSLAWVYGQHLTVPPSDGGQRIRSIDVYDPAQKIANYSHVALTYAPQNPIFGEQGSHRECGQNIGLVTQKEAQACLQSSNPWKGEIGSNSDAQRPFQRLSYHPRFDEMMVQVSAFIRTH